MVCVWWKEFHKNTTTMFVKEVSSSKFLRNLVPTRRILSLLFVSAIDRTDNRVAGVGAAISDPYLSFAAPLKSKDTTQSLRDYMSAVTNEHDVGGVVLITKPLVSNTSSFVSMSAQQAMDQLSQSTSSSSSSTSLMKYIESDVNKTLEEVLQEHQENPLWDSIPIDDLVSRDGTLKCIGEAEGAASLQATVGLQMFLDEHCGGWQNTFG